MTKFKHLGLALIAVLAMTAVSASAAQAVSYHSEVKTTYLTGQQLETAAGRNTFDIESGTVKCAVAKTAATFFQEITGTETAANDFSVNELSIAPTCTGATLLGQAATVNFNGCTYEFNQPTSTTSARVWVKCPAGKEITVTSAECTVHVPEQGSTAAPVTGALTLTAGGEKTSRDITVKSGVEKLTYKIVSPSLPICGTLGTHTDGKYTGEVTVKGYKNVAHTEQVGIWVA